MKKEQTVASVWAEVLALKRRLSLLVDGAGRGGRSVSDMTGDVTGSGPGTTTTTISNDAVTNAKLANMGEGTIKLRPVGAGTGDPVDGTANQASTILDSATDPFLRTSAATSGAYTNEQAQDAVGTILVDSSTIDFTYSDPTPSITASVKSASISPTELTTAAKAATVGITIDGGGSAITTGVKGYVQLPFAMTVTAARLFADQTGSIVIDVWKDSYANFPPVDADSITASAPPTLSSAQKSEDTTLTGWTTNLSSGDVIGFNVDSAATVTRVTLQLLGTRT